MKTTTYFVTTEKGIYNREIVGRITTDLPEAEALFHKTAAPKGGMLRLTRRDHEDGQNHNVTLLTKYPS